MKKIPVEFPQFSLPLLNFGRSRKVQGRSIVKKIPVDAPKVFFGRSRKTPIELASQLQGGSSFENDLMVQSMARIDGTILLTEDNFKSNVMESNDMWLVLFVDPTKGVFHV